MRIQLNRHHTPHVSIHLWSEYIYISYISYITHYTVTVRTCAYTDTHPRAYEYLIVRCESSAYIAKRVIPYVSFSQLHFATILMSMPVAVTVPSVRTPCYTKLVKHSRHTNWDSTANNLHLSVWFPLSIFSVCTEHILLRYCGIVLAFVQKFRQFSICS